MEGKAQNHQQRTFAIPHPYPVCGFEDGFGGKVLARNRAGAPCGNAAGAGTDHVGWGRCKFHGGRMQKKPPESAASLIKGGLLNHPEFAEKLVQYKDDTEVFNLRREIAYLKSISDVLIERDDLAGSIRALDKVGKLAEQLHNIEIGRKYVISIDNLNLLIQRTVQVVRRHVTDEHTRTLIAEDLMKIQLTTGNDQASEHQYAELEDGRLLPSGDSEATESGESAGGYIIEGVEVEELDSSERPEDRYRSV